MGGPAYFVVAASPYWQVSKTRRAASRLAARSTQRVPSRSGHRAGDVAQHVADLVADGAHRRDGGDRDQRGDQHVLDGGGAIIVLHQLAENGQHGNLQKESAWSGDTREPYVWEAMDPHAHDRGACTKALPEICSSWCA